ncbi:glycosyltransferase family 4 protein [Natrinema ejinorense]|uniref:Glycosyltransferase n=1 Tax=Natrinema ejinorense TaxID=373386 RepID=A0A2A5QUN4_9EURY|nr:glycosyltransferase family 4 protein [Natrinema ejinorense]PCR90469.1 glycosyltransferase [Natrinema ejinorense]
MKVCYLINQLAPGGAPTLLLDIARNMDEGVSVTVCQIEGDTDLTEKLTEAGAEVVNFGADFKFDPRAIARMISFFRQNEFDILHAHLPYSQTLARTIGRAGNVDTIVSTQQSFPDNYHPITRFLERHTRWLDDATVGITEAITQAFRESPVRTDWYTIYNGTDIPKFAENVAAADPDQLRSELGLEDELIFLNVGRYVPVKSQKDAIRAMAAGVDQFSDSHLLIVGWGPLEEDLKQLATDLGIADSVTVTGRVPKDEIHEYYALGDVFVLPSISEGFGICLTEAMAASLPVVASDIPGVREVVADGETGFLVPPREPAEFATAMKDLQSEQKRRTFGKAGFQRAAERFDIKSIVESHMDLYDQLMAKNRA